ncbi:aminoglycoside phosphotransferase family protein [Aliiroseovarius crassostreae]|uniref:aminoglycoside phosphotransferase family protein n=1 Tax=Aliiroseovarius crassostreae TaxID=154981 RepID=UPI003C7D27AC
MNKAEREQTLLAKAMAALPGHGALGQRFRHVPPRILSSRFLPEEERIVLMLSDARHDAAHKAVVYKFKDGPADAARFEQKLKAHRFAYDALGGQRVPQLLSVDPAAQSVIFQHVPGRTVHETLELAEFGLADAQDAMRRSGKWLAAFHQATAQPGRAIRPDAMMGWVAEMQNSVLTRQVDVPRRDLYLICAEQAFAICESVRGAHTPVAASHGDFHLRNLLLDDDKTYGLDFDPTRFVPPGHDLSKFLLRYRIWFGGRDDSPPVQAFWQGYGAKDENAAAVRFLFPIQLLGDWRKMPKRREDRSAGQQRQFKRLLTLAKEVFDLSG